jgi:hypothetical protein
MASYSLRSRWDLIPVLALAALLGTPIHSSAQEDVRFYGLNSLSSFPGAIAPNTFQMACAQRQDQLQQHFSYRRQQYVPNVLRRVDDLTCHLVYEPTVAGFRAHAESDAITGAFADVPHLRFLAQPGEPLGDSLDILKSVLAQAPETLDISLGVSVNVPRAYVDRALAAHFPSTRHRIRIRPNPEEQTNAWSKDFIQSGTARGNGRVLAPRRIFEGIREHGDRYKPLLDALPAKITTRSRLSWEGGDLLFVNDPRHAGRLLMFYGDAARPYWAADLAEEEYAYVLAAEFGAQEAVYLGSVAPHIDYVVSFLPEHGIALVGRPVTGNLEIARAAARMLSLTFSAPVPPVVRQIESALEAPDSLRASTPVLRTLIAQARRENGEWSVPIDAGSYAQIEQYMAQHCPNDALGCTSPAHLPILISSQPALFANWVRMAVTLKTAQGLPAAMLSVIEDQLPGETAKKEQRLNEHVRTLEKLGFRVVRIPWIGGEPSGADAWAGISYANMVLLGRRLFVPVFGLGPAEQRLVESIETLLPAGYRVVPVFARSALLQSGGVHCALGVVRGPGIL